MLYVRSLLVAALLLVLVTPALAQPPFGKRPQFLDRDRDQSGLLERLVGSEKMADLKLAVQGIALYPEEVRNAILDLCGYAVKYPKLIDDLVTVRSKSDAQIDAYLTGNNYSTELQQTAAIVLVDAPEALDVMQENEELVAIVGKLTENQRVKSIIQRQLSEAHERLSKIEAASTDAWSAQLAANQESMEEYQQLMADYTQAQQEAAGSSEPIDQTYESYDYGMYYEPSASGGSGGWVVYSTPPSGLVNYALMYPYLYPNVYNDVIHHYMFNQNLEEFTETVSNWYQQYGGEIPEEARQQYADYYNQLESISQFEEQFQQHYQGDATAAQARAEYLQQASEKYPQLSSWHEQAQNAAANPPAKVQELARNSSSPFSDLKERRQKDQGPLTNRRNPTQRPEAGKGPFSARKQDSPFAGLAQKSPGSGGPVSNLKSNRPTPSAKLPKPSTANRPTPRTKSAPVYRGKPSQSVQLNRSGGQLKSSWGGGRSGGNRGGARRGGGRRR